MKISFDFDDTLDRPDIQNLAEQFINEGHEVWIVSNRVTEESWNRDLYKVAEHLGISNILLLGVIDKYKFLEDFDYHYDDTEDIINEINNNLNKCKGILVK